MPGGWWISAQNGYIRQLGGYISAFPSTTFVHSFAHVQYAHGRYAFLKFEKKTLNIRTRQSEKQANTQIFNLFLFMKDLRYDQRE